LPTVVGVRLRSTPKMLWFDPVSTSPEVGDSVVVETERGTEFGHVLETPHEVAIEELHAALKPVVRVATEADLVFAEELEAKEAEALPAFKEAVEKSGLDIKAVDVEYLFSGDKAIFYFTAEDRVDFRDLVRDLAAQFKVRVDMRQIGVRDEARLVGGVGHCGQVLCCVRFGGEFQPVSIRMAKEQDLPLNPLKISGLCGRLMCCLRYEYDAYKDFKSRAPKRGAMVETPAGTAKVTDLNTPKELVTVRTQEGANVTVPLASMGCCKGGTCPCSVDEDAFAEAAGTRPAAVAVLETPELETASSSEGRRTSRPPSEAASDKPAGGNGGGGGQRRRRDRGRGGRGRQGAGEGSKEQKPQQQSASKSGANAAQSPQGGAEPKSEPKGEPNASGGGESTSGRRRRRRRSSGGGAGGGEQVQ
jgi:cell fate regulator YaaT (PSP1 superfamily)